MEIQLYCQKFYFSKLAEAYYADLNQDVAEKLKVPIRHSDKRHEKEVKKKKSVRFFRGKCVPLQRLSDEIYEKEQIFHHIDSCCRRSSPYDGLLEA